MYASWCSVFHLDTYNIFLLSILSPHFFRFNFPYVIDLKIKKKNTEKEERKTFNSRVVFSNVIVKLENTLFQTTCEHKKKALHITISFHS